MATTWRRLLGSRAKMPAATNVWLERLFLHLQQALELLAPRRLLPQAGDLRVEALVVGAQAVVLRCEGADVAVVGRPVSAIGRATERSPASSGASTDEGSVLDGAQEADTG